jgi:hypothetical protein
MRAYVGLIHPSIIQIKDFFISNVDKYGFCNFNIVMEYCLIKILLKQILGDGGDLEHFIKSQTKPIPNDVSFSCLNVF